MRISVLATLPLATAALLLSAGTASADTVGMPGTPNCFGQRISHGSSDHDLSPKERAAALQEFVDAGDPWPWSSSGRRCRCRSSPGS